MQFLGGELPNQHYILIRFQILRSFEKVLNWQDMHPITIGLNLHAFTYWILYESKKIGKLFGEIVAGDQSDPALIERGKKNPKNGEMLLDY